METLRNMLSGTKFQLRIEGIRAQILTPGLNIKRAQKEMPNIEFDLNLLTI
jgi:hypothetical protein